MGKKGMNLRRILKNFKLLLPYFKKYLKVKWKKAAWRSEGKQKQKVMKNPKTSNMTDG